MLIFTDGSHSTKPRMSGLGAVILFNNREHTFGTYTNKCRDNNVAEIAAIAMAVQYIRDNKIVERMEDKTITIISDSETALRKINQKSQGQDEFESACLDYIQDFLTLTKKKIKFMQIKGHVHDGTKLSHYNNVADDLAGDYRRIGLELHRTRVSKKHRNNYHHLIRFKNNKEK